jgi:hypothetical protein
MVRFVGSVGVHYGQGMNDAYMFQRSFFQNSIHTTFKMQNATLSLDQRALHAATMVYASTRRNLRTCRRSRRAPCWHRTFSNDRDVVSECEDQDNLAADTEAAIEVWYENHWLPSD